MNVNMKLRQPIFLVFIAITLLASLTGCVKNNQTPQEPVTLKVLTWNERTFLQGDKENPTDGGVLPYHRWGC